jgi:hypothetical protein
LPAYFFNPSHMLALHFFISNTFSKYFSPLTLQKISIFLLHFVKIGGNHLSKG